MESFDIVVCDDEDYCIDDIKIYIKDYEISEGVKFNISEYHSGEQLIKDIQDKKMHYDIIFMDVEMKGKNGVETAKVIRSLNKSVVICFVTSHEKYALNAFMVEAIDYLIKPVNTDKIKRLLDRAIINIRYCQDKTDSDKRYIQIKNQNEMMLIDVNRILFIEKLKNQCIFHLENDQVKCYETLGHMKDKLDGNQFIYTHQGYIVNFAKIKEVKKTTVCFGDGIEVPVSRKYYSTLRDQHLDKINRLRKERAEKYF